MKAADNHNEVFLDHKTMKTWVDQKTGSVCYMLYPRSLYITWGSDRDYWSWDCFKETSDENIEVARLIEVCWLEVIGKRKISDLSPGVFYEVVLVVKLTTGASGWELPVRLILSLPDGTRRERRMSLLEKPRGEWMELNMGNFLPKQGETGEFEFNFSGTGDHWKKGLIIKGAILRPKSS